MSASAGHGIYYGKNENDRLQPITWLNDNYSLFLESEKKIDSRESPADSFSL